MKRILAVILGCFVAAGAFAEFSFSFRSEFHAYLFSTIIPTGLYAQKTMINDAGVEVPNIGTTHLDAGWLFAEGSGNRWGYYVPSGGYNFFTTRIAYQSDTNIAWRHYFNHLNDMRLGVYYTRTRMEFYIGFNFRNLLYLFTDRSDPKLVRVSEMFNDLFIDEFRIKAELSMFDFWFGNMDFTSRVDPYQDFTDWSIFTKVDRFGVNVPRADFNRYLYYNMDNNTFRRSLTPANITQYEEAMHFLGDIKLLDYYFSIPITVGLAMDISHRPINHNAAGSSFTNPSQIRVGGGIKISGNRLFDQVNFDMTYKLRGGDGSRDDSWDPDINPGGGVQPDGTGRTAHMLGLNVGLPRLVPSLGIAFGYTALFAVYEDHLYGLHSTPSVTDPYTVTKTGPVYNGIDLRLRYSGIPGFRFTLNNNISFARSDEPVYNDDGIQVGISVPVTGAGTLNQYRSQSWLALYNAFGIRYTVSALLRTGLEVIHRMAVITENNSNQSRGSGLMDWGTSERIRQILQASAYAHFTLSDYVVMETGLSLWYENSNTAYSRYLDPDFEGPNAWRGGGLGFGIPIRVTFRW